MRKIVTTSFLFLAVLAFGGSPALAAQSHNMNMGHHDHAAMNHATMDHSPEAGHKDGHGEDLKDVIPPIQVEAHGEHGNGSHGEKKSCEHHVVCPTDHLCSLKEHQCDTSNDFEATQTCAISSECGGGLPQQAFSPTHDHEFTITSFLYNNYKISIFFRPPPMEVSLAGFPGKLEPPPQSNS